MDELAKLFWQIRQNSDVEGITRFWKKYGYQLEKQEEKYEKEIKDYVHNVKPEIDQKMVTSSTASMNTPSAEREPIKVCLDPQSAYAGMKESFPREEGFRFGSWWPNPGEPAHIMVLGKTGSGKSDLVQRLYRSGDFGETSFHYVTNKPLDKMPVERMQEHAKTKLKEMRDMDPESFARYASTGADPNFKMQFAHTNDFQSYFSLDALHKQCPSTGKKQHSVVVFDDDSYTSKLNLAKMGRSRGLSCIMVQQDWISDTSNSGVRPQLSGVWFVGPLGRKSEENLRYASALGLTKSEVDKLQTLLKLPTTHAVFVNPNDNKFFVVDKKI